MVTVLKQPEEIMCSQNEEMTSENDHIYFIAKGKCKVIVKDKFNDRHEEYNVRILYPQMHFGEISMLYRCKRSASVEATNYTTCAQMDRSNYSELLQLYPQMNEVVK